MTRSTAGPSPPTASGSPSAAPTTRRGSSRSRTARRSLKIDHHSDWVFGTAFSLDGKHLITLGRDGSIKLTEAGTGSFIDDIGKNYGELKVLARHPKEDTGRHRRRREDPPALQDLPDAGPRHELHRLQPPEGVRGPARPDLGHRLRPRRQHPGRRRLGRRGPALQRGRRRPARRPSRATSAGSTPSPSAPTARGSPPAASTATSGSSTPPTGNLAASFVPVPVEAAKVAAKP